MPSARQPTTFLQFSLRSFLAAVSILTVLFAVFVPLVQAQPPALREYLSWVVLVSAILAVAGLLVFCVLRWRVETRGGQLLLRPKHAIFWIEHLASFIMVVVFAGILVGVFIATLPAMSNMQNLERDLDIYLILLMWPVSAIAAPMLGLVYAFVLLWWRVTPLTLEIREHGIGLGALRFLPWSGVTAYRWTDGKHGAVLTISASSRRHVAVISFDERDAVQRLLDANGV